VNFNFLVVMGFILLIIISIPRLIRDTRYQYVLDLDLDTPEK